MERRMDVIINQPDPNNITLPETPFIVANISQEAYLVGIKMEAGKPLFYLTNLAGGDIITLEVDNLKMLLAQKSYTIPQCSIKVDL